MLKSVKFNLMKDFERFMKACERFVRDELSQTLIESIIS